MKAKIHVTLKNGVLDPEGRAIGHALESLGFKGINDVRKGTYIEIDLKAADKKDAKAKAEDMCKKLLANPIIENYTVDISD